MQEQDVPTLSSFADRFPSMTYSKVTEFSLPIFPRGIEGLNVGAWWPTFAELDSRFNVLFFTLEDCFDFTVW